MNPVTAGFRTVVVSLAVALSLATAPLGAETSAFQCTAGASRGVPAADAQTAVEMVCEALAQRAGRTGTYEVTLRPLGRKILLTAGRLDPPGARSLQLETIEEVATAAPRIAEALVSERPLDTTQRVDNLLEFETHTTRSKQGSVRFAVGVSDFTPIGHGGSGAGFSLGLLYSAPQIALPVDLRFGWNARDAIGREASFVAVSAGARRYLSKRDTSPFVGGGLSMLHLEASEGAYGSGYFHGERLGMAPYLETGVEILRLHRARLAFLVRVDLPTGSLRSEEYPIYVWDPALGQERMTETARSQSRYVAPASLGMTVAF
jgi:hypothetical protein